MTRRIQFRAPPPLVRETFGNVLYKVIAVCCVKLGKPYGADPQPDGIPAPGAGETDHASKWVPRLAAIPSDRALSGTSKLFHSWRASYGRAMDDDFSGPTFSVRVLSCADVTSIASSATPVRLVDCDLVEAQLEGLDLIGWQFARCDMRRVVFKDAQLEGTAWASCRGAFANFVGADLTDATFTSCDFNNAVLRAARMSQVSFTGCKLTGADLSDVTATDAHFEETLLVGAKLASFSFRKQQLKRIDFSHADLNKADFRESEFNGCSLRDANLAGARFDKADLRGADLGGLRLIDARLFRGATISREQAGHLLAELGLRLG